MSSGCPGKLTLYDCAASSAPCETSCAMFSATSPRGKGPKRVVPSRLYRIATFAMPRSKKSSPSGCWPREMRRQRGSSVSSHCSRSLRAHSGVFSLQAWPASSSTRSSKGAPTLWQESHVMPWKVIRRRAVRSRSMSVLLCSSLARPGGSSSASSAFG